MADFDPNQVAAELRKTGQYSDEEIASVLADMMGDEPGTPQALQLRTGAGRQGLVGTQKAAAFLGPAIGGFYGAQAAAGRNLLPFLGGAGRAITQFAGEAAGTTLGDVAGRAAAGQQQEPKKSLRLGLGGAAVGSGLRGLVQVGGMVGGVPESATMAAAEPVKAKGMPLPIPNLRRMMRAGPHTPAQVKAGISPEATLVERASTAAAKASKTVTAARLEKEAIIRQATASGVRIPVAPIQDALRQHLITDPAAVTQEARVVNAKIDRVVKGLEDAAANSGGTLSPVQVDRLIREQLRPRVYTGSGQPSHTMFAEPMASAERSATEALTNALPGDLAAKNAAISEKLTATEQAVKLFGDPDRAGVTTRLSTAFNRGNETSVRALNVLAEHDPKLVDDAYDLYVRRQFAGDIREPAMGGMAGFFGTMVRKPVELGTRAIAPFQRFAGGAAAGTKAAFVRKYKPKEPEPVSAPSSRKATGLWKETPVDKSPENMFAEMINASRQE